MTGAKWTAVEFRVLHRLALGVEVADAVTGRPVGSVTGRAVDALTGRVVAEAKGPRLKVRHEPHRELSGEAVLTFGDPGRRYVPRRLRVPLWRAAELERAERDGEPVPVLARALRVFLHPGCAYPLPRGTTAVRGTVPVPWSRVMASPPGRPVIAHAHADDRGEFLLVVADPGALGPAANRPVELEFTVAAPAGPADVPPEEPVPRTAAEPPPAFADLDTPLMRGREIPPGYAVSSSPGRLTLVPGEVRVAPESVLFTR